MSWHVYMMEGSGGRLYTGITTDLERRLYEHNNVWLKASKWAWAHRPLKLVWSAEKKNRSEASKAEARIKKLNKKKKRGLIDGRLVLGKGEKAPYAPGKEEGLERSPSRGHIEPPQPCGLGCQGHVSHPCERCGRQWGGGEVIPSMTELVSMVRADNIAGCSEEHLVKHRALGATMIRRILLRHGLKEGWERVKKIFEQPILGMTRLERDLTDDEMAILAQALGYEFDRSGNPVGRIGDGDIRRGDRGGGRGLPKGRREAIDLE